MRRLLACLLIALVVPAPAGATSLPPLRGLGPLVRFVPASSQRNNASCSEHGRSARAQRLAKKLAPVACEQPPRPHVRNALPGPFLAP